MRHQVLSHPSFATSTRTLSPWSSAWARANDAMRAALVEVALYACGSPRSRLHGRAALRELDARLRRDVGLAAVAPHAMRSVGLEGHR